MNAILKTFLSMSFSGGLLILALLLGKRFLKDRISRQWQYYIWLVVIARLLLPFGMETSLLGETYGAVDQAVTRAVSALSPQQPVSSQTESSPQQSEPSQSDLLPQQSELSQSESLPQQSGPSQPEHLPQQSMPLQQPEFSQQQPARSSPEGSPASAVNPEKGNESADSLTGEMTIVNSIRDIAALLINYIWLLWLVVAMGLLLRKVTVYQDFVRYTGAGSSPVSDIEILDRLSLAAQQAGVRKPVELWVNPLISSPMLIGFFHPCIVLPRADFSEKDFRYIALHELTHYRRGDMFYKWLVQLTVCLHWFNPLVYLMSREIARACEFSCDEAVLVRMGDGCAEEYGKTLLDAMAAAGKYRESPGAVTLGENKKLLKERLGAIMKFRAWSKKVKIFTAALTFCVILGAAFIGVYKMGTAAGSVQAAALSGTQPGPAGWQAGTMVGRSGAADGQPGTIATQSDTAGGQAGETDGQSDAAGAQADPGGRERETAGVLYPRDPNGIGMPRENSAPSFTADMQSEETDSRSLDAERYYEDGNLPLFQIVFARMDEADQDKWLDRVYTDSQLTFLGAAVGLLDEDCGFIRKYAEKAYQDNDTACFSVLIMHMSEDTLEEWFDRALEDEKWNFQSMLFDALDWDDESDETEQKRKEWDKDKDEWEKEWEQAQTAEYGAVGVTMDGKNYYYKEQLVNIFLDIRANKSFYTLNRNPKGTVNIKIIRGEDGKITGVAYMTEEEVKELFGEEECDDPMAPSAAKDKEDGKIIPVDLESVAVGEAVFLGEYTLSDGDEIRYDVLAETGNGIEIFFVKGEEWNTLYYAAHWMRQQGEPLKCTTDFTVGPPAEPGTYKLYLRGADGALEKVKGSISIL